MTRSFPAPAMRVIAPSSPYWAKGVAQHNNLGQPHQGLVAAWGSCCRVRNPHSCHYISDHGPYRYSKVTSTGLLQTNAVVSPRTQCSSSEIRGQIDHPAPETPTRATGKNATAVTSFVPRCSPSVDWKRPTPSASTPLFWTRSSFSPSQQTIFRIDTPCPPPQPQQRQQVAGPPEVPLLTQHPRCRRWQPAPPLTDFGLPNPGPESAGQRDALQNKNL